MHGRSLPKSCTAIEYRAQNIHQKLSTDKFAYGNNLFTADLSELRIEITPTITLYNPKTGNERMFQYGGPEYNDGEVVGYRYQGHEGLSILIIND